MATKKKGMAAVRNLTKDELNTKIREAEKELFESRIKLTARQLDNTSRPWFLRKEIARMKTYLTELDKKAAAPAQKAGN